MKKLKIPIHSTTDLITNSSTVIFTYSESAEPAFIEMIDELFKTFGIDKKCDEVFKTVILCDDEYTYEEYLEELDEYPEGVTSESNINQLIDDVKTGKIDKPTWFTEAEEAENHYQYYNPPTYLYLIPKEKEYEKLGNLVHKFLYSTNHEATRDG